MSEQGSIRNRARRRFIAITAAAAGFPLLPVGRAAAAGEQAVTWRGLMLGAAAHLQIHHPDRAAAERLVERSVAEARRLERLFSLYRQDSALVALNRSGVLVAPPPEFVSLLAECRRYAALSSGAFDPTVQPLWALYANHFGMRGGASAGPSSHEIEQALPHIGFQRLRFDRDRIVFMRAGMALTFNGIAQGYITDRVVDVLRAGGINHSLVDMGEARVLGSRPEGGPWRVGIADPEQPSAAHEVLDVIDQAVSTSAGYGFRFDAGGRFNHLFDPRTGLSPNRYRSVTVIAPTATAADALSTAFSVMAIERIDAALKQIGAVRAHVTTARGERLILGA